jgi:hypothetical protein
MGRHRAKVRGRLMRMVAAVTTQAVTSDTSITTAASARSGAWASASVLAPYYDGGSWYQGGAYYETLPIEPETAIPAPIIYPRNGQSPEQTEADRQDCKSRHDSATTPAVCDGTGGHRPGAWLQGTEGPARVRLCAAVANLANDVIWLL